MTGKTLPEPWLPFFNRLDEEINEETRLYCLGGFIVTVLYGAPRSTADVDIVMLIPPNDRLLTLAGEGSELHRQYGVYLDWNGVATLPENYEDRVEEIFADVFKNLRLFTLDPYDLALSKLERNIQRDRDDVKYLAKSATLDLGVLKERYQSELRPLLGIPEREDLTLKLWIETIEEERGK